MSELDGFEVMPHIDQRTNKGKIASRGKRIAELTVERDAFFEMVKRVQADCDARDELIRDMWKDLVGLQGGYDELGYQTSLPEFAKRMRELGIEVDE